MTTSTRKFNQKLEEISEITEKLEKSDISLEDSLEAFERGVKLAREAQLTLAEAEQRVHQLLVDSEGLEQAQVEQKKGADLNE